MRKRTAKTIKNPGRSQSYYGSQARRFIKAACERCGVGGQLHAHHKDRDRSNNISENIETLCPNCHYAEHSRDWSSNIESCFICGKPVRAENLCNHHYHRKWRYGDPLGHPNWEEVKKKMARKPLTKKPCRVCGAPWIKRKSKKDLCSVHREPKKKRIRKPRITKKYCSLCQRPLLARGYCTAHYKRFKLYGDARGGLWEMDSSRADSQRVPINKVVNKDT